MSCTIHKQVCFLLEALQLLTSKLIDMHLSLFRLPTSPKNRSIIKISENNMERIPIIPQLQPHITMISQPTFLEPLKTLLARLSHEKEVAQRPCIIQEETQRELQVLKQRTCELEYEVKNMGCDLGELIVLFKQGVMAQ